MWKDEEEGDLHEDRIQALTKRRRSLSAGEQWHSWGEKARPPGVPGPTPTKDSIRSFGYLL